MVADEVLGSQRQSPFRSVMHASGGQLHPVSTTVSLCLFCTFGCDWLKKCWDGALTH